MKKLTPIKPFQEMLNILLYKMENFSKSNTQDIQAQEDLYKQIQYTLSFHPHLTATLPFIQLAIKDGLSNHWPLIKQVLTSNTALTDKYIPFAFVSHLMTLNGCNKSEAMRLLGANHDSKEITAIYQNRIGYFQLKKQLHNLININNKTLNLLLIESNELIESKAFIQTIDEAHKFKENLNENDNQYYHKTIDEIINILNNGYFNESDISYLIFLSCFLSHLDWLDFPYLYAGFENNEFLSCVSREYDEYQDIINLKLFNGEKVQIQTALIKDIDKFITSSIKTLSQEFDVELQTFETEVNLIAPIRQKNNYGFIEAWFQIINTINSFNIVVENSHFEALFEKTQNVKKLLDSGNAQPILYFIETLLVIPHVFNNNHEICQRYEKKWGIVTNIQLNDNNLFNSNNIDDEIKQFVNEIDYKQELQQNTQLFENFKEHNMNINTNIESNSTNETSLIDNSNEYINDISGSDVTTTNTSPLPAMQSSEVVIEVGDEKNETVEVGVEEENKLNTELNIPTYRDNRVHKRIMGDPLDVNQINIKDSPLHDLRNNITLLEEFVEFTLPKSIFDKLKNNTLTFDDFNVLYKSNENAMLLIQQAQEKYSIDVYNQLYRIFHTYKGDFVALSMILAGEVAHQGAYMIRSISEQERVMNEQEAFILQQIIQALYGLIVKLYYAYVLQSERFPFYNEALSIPMEYTLNAFLVHLSILQAHGKPIAYNTTFIHFINELGYEWVDGQLFLIDKSNPDLISENNIEPMMAIGLSKTTPESEATRILNQAVNVETQTEQHAISQEKKEAPSVSETTNGTIEIHRQPIIIELQPERYVANGIFVQSNDGYIINQKRRVSIQDWIMGCNNVLEQTENIIPYFNQMLGGKIGLDDIQLEFEYNINHLEYALNSLINMCADFGLDETASLITTFIDLVNEYRDANPYQFSVQIENGKNHIFNNHLIGEEFNTPLFVSDYMLINFASRLVYYLQQLFRHNPLDGLNREDVFLLRHQIIQYTEKCRHSALGHMLMWNEQKRLQQIQVLINNTSDHYTKMIDNIEDIAVNNSTLMVAAQKQETAAINLMNFVSEKVEIQTTILDNQSSSVEYIKEGVVASFNKLNVLESFIQAIHKGLSQSKMAKWIFKTNNNSKS